MMDARYGGQQVGSAVDVRDQPGQSRTTATAVSDADQLKYHWGVRGARLFSEAGPSFRASGNLQSSTPPSRYGFTAGAGIEKRAKRIGIAPALRYTHWSEGRGYGGSPGSTLYNPNSVELVVGVSF